MRLLADALVCAATFGLTFAVVQAISGEVHAPTAIGTVVALLLVQFYDRTRR